MRKRNFAGVINLKNLEAVEPALCLSELSLNMGDRMLIQRLSLEIPPAGKWALIGETGSGKTTLLKAVGGLIQPAEGGIYWKGERVLGPEEKLIAGHDKIAYLSQHFELRNNYYVHELLDYGNKLPAEKATALYHLCRIDQLLSRKTNQLSGGERQRVALSMLLSREPELLLLDEPFSNLDLAHKQLIREVLEDLADVWQLTIMMASHDSADTLAWADRLLVMRNGAIIQEGEPRELFYYPETPYSAALLGVYNRVPESLGNALLPRGSRFEYGKSIFARPDQLLILPGHSGTGLPGIVERVYFQGSSLLARVRVRETELWISTVNGQVEPGDSVRILFSGDRVWYL